MSPVPENTPVIEAHNLGKAYRIWKSPSSRLWHPLSRSLASLLPAPLRRRLFPQGHWRGRPSWRDFHALEAVSLQIRRGEAIGIIGRNGSGKSTLLQLIAGTLSPSSGAVQTRGRVAALLELGSGFNPEFTGRENVFLNASVLGLTRAETEARFADILEYSGIGDFIDQPVRTYSSGMMLRLAFAVAAHVDPDVLIVDEALGVGDARFQLKCARTIDGFLSRGVTLLFVSHDASSIKRLCNRALLLEAGKVIHEGSPNEVVNLYSKLIAEGGSLDSIAADLESLRAADSKPTAIAPLPPVPTGAFAGASDSSAGGLESRIRLLESALAAVVPLSAARGEALHADAARVPPASEGEFSYGGQLGRIESIQIMDAAGSGRLHYVSGEQVVVSFSCVSDEYLQEPIYALTLKSSTGVEVYGTNTLFSGLEVSPMPPGCRRLVRFQLPLHLQPGYYFVSLGFTQFVGDELLVIHRRYDAVRLQVLPSDRSFGIANLQAHIWVGDADALTEGGGA